MEEEKKVNHYHFKCMIYFPTKEISRIVARKLTEAGFESFSPRRNLDCLTYYVESEDIEDLIMDSHLEEFVLDTQKAIGDGVEAIEANGGSISIVIGLHEYSDTISVALHATKLTLEILAKLHADLDIDRYYYDYNSKEDYDE